VESTEPSIYRGRVIPNDLHPASEGAAPFASGENDIRVPRGRAQEVADLLKAIGTTAETIFYPAEGLGFLMTSPRAFSSAHTRHCNWCNAMR
jgi:hypothetical protein